MIFLQNLALKLEKIIGLRAENPEKITDNSNKIIDNPETETVNEKIKEDLGHYKKVLKGDYSHVLQMFKDDCYYSLEHVPQKFKNDKFVVGVALEKDLIDMRFVGSDIINDTKTMQDLLLQAQTKGKEQLKIPLVDIEVGAGTTLIIKGIEYQHIDGLENLLKNKDYKKEFDNLYPNCPHRTLSTEFLRKNPDVYIKLHEAVDNTLTQNLRSINQNTSSTNNMTF